MYVHMYLVYNNYFVYVYVAYSYSILSYSWAFYPGGVVENYCSSNGNSLHFNGRLTQNTLTTLDLYISSDTFVQFDLITTCSSSTSDLFYIQLEYSTNGGLTWSVIENDCQGSCETQGL